MRYLRICILASLCVAAFGQPSDSTLYVAKDTSWSRIASDVSAGALTITVADGSKFVVNELVVIEGTEQRRITAINGNVLTIDSALTSAHSAGNCTRTGSAANEAHCVTGMYLAAHHNALKDAIKTLDGQVIKKTTGTGIVRQDGTTVTGTSTDCVKVSGSSGACGTGGSLGAGTAAAVVADTSGALQRATGNATDCIKVNGSSGACGTGSGGGASVVTDLGDLKPTLATGVGTIAAGSYRIDDGDYSLASSGTINSATGSGTIYVYADYNSHLVVAGYGGSVTAVSVTGLTPVGGITTWPTGSVHIGRYTVSSNAITAVADDRTAFGRDSGGGTSAPTGIITQDEGSPIGSGQLTVNFAGSGVTCTSNGTTTTCTIPGGAGVITQTEEISIGSCYYNGSNTTWVFTPTRLWFGTAAPSNTCEGSNTLRHPMVSFINGAGVSQYAYFVFTLPKGYTGAIDLYMGISTTIPPGTAATQFDISTGCVTGAAWNADPSWGSSQPMPYTWNNSSTVRTISLTGVTIPSGCNSEMNQVGVLITRNNSVANNLAAGVQISGIQVVKRGS